MLIKKFKAHNLLQIARSQTWKKQKKTKKTCLVPVVCKNSPALSETPLMELC